MEYKSRYYQRVAIESYILGCGVHGCTEDNLRKGLGMHNQYVSVYLDALTSDGTVEEQDGKYFHSDVPVEEDPETFEEENEGEGNATE